MPAFIPTHYTALPFRFYNEGEVEGRIRQPNEAVMQVEGPSVDGLVKVLDGDGRYAWLHEKIELYTGPRRS